MVTDDLQRKRVVWSGEGRSKRSSNSSAWITAAREGVCCDMWQPYIDVIKDRAPQAVPVFDEFHIVRYLMEAVGQVHRHEQDIRNYFHMPIDNGSVGGLDRKAKLVIHKAYGFHNAKNTPAISIIASARPSSTPDRACIRVRIPLMKEESLIMKTEKHRDTLKARVQPRSAKRQSAKAGIKMRSGLRAGGYRMGFTDMY